ncbi:hypothetical protein L9W92_13165 [Pelotomaculum terephthalicicum JT]|uniref:hypothetical protein n=1 Tax=Pelotomaculum terephthalicicum TaxID=206393 RepID=UPI001F03E61C|nr:hypothetical protein [Pelotomaculum terephthalicicum]MCG9968985.1 hypothetical protein [Pelotomaculum terephthalicicum JT]
MSDYVLFEPKIGIGRDSQTRTTADHMLYRAAMRRLESEIKGGSINEKVFLLVDFTGLDLPGEG